MGNFRTGPNLEAVRDGLFKEMKLNLRSEEWEEGEEQLGE